MGTWSAEVFGNDEACDWLGQLEQTEDFALVAETLDEVLAAGDEYLEIDVAHPALAAAEVVAQALGRPGKAEGVADRIGEWLELDCQQALPPDLAEKAQAAIARVLRPPCEALEGWADPADLSEWRANVKELQARLAERGGRNPVVAATGG